ncbi:type IV secretory system conjugative DNA transfer family protein [Catalinimonas niigatensis]|uniref:type IV secretory system conjugative DNA transfer family protein n=1 Tax=Catalinimonas niigatensis TaxID=1397264 RepID=UPI002665DE14|nr:type IV secretory system conjugative DNA transfer family protein [Catalinimonas niigatensis]WPP51767.1 type IV secretory system conjugative DNA transfer family protein [Catalinimonas niigatensis]
MSQHTTTLELLLLCFLFLLALMGAEYYLLIQVDRVWIEKLHPLLQRAIQLLLFFGKGIRFVALLNYLGIVVLFLSPDPAQQKRKPLSFWITVAGVGLAVLSIVLLFKVNSYPSSTIYWLFPSSLLGVLLSMPLVLYSVYSRNSKRKEQYEHRKVENADSIHISTQTGWINVTNPFRGTLVIGSSGSGKSESIGNAFIHQFIQKGYCGVLYDFKFPALANEVNRALHLYGKNTNLKYYIINFQNPTLSHRCNPLAPENIPTVAHAEEYARSIVNNLDTSTIKQRDFFSNSAIAWLSSLIWFFRSEHPQHCTLPHVINTALYKDYMQVISMLQTNAQSADMSRSIATAIENKAEKQIAGVIASLQIMVSKINSPEIVWTLTGDDLDMNINDPAHPKLLCLGSDPSLVDTFSPVISLIITVALKQMNQQGKQKSFVLLDEAPTLYIPKFEMIPATARSNKIASVYMAQDYAQMIDMYGREKAEVIIANLSNQFYGKISSVQTAKAVSEMIGKEERLITNHSRGSSRGSKGGRNISYNTSISQQERSIIKPQEIMQLQAGEFVGQTVESTLPYFWTRFKKKQVSNQHPIAPFASIEEKEKILLLNFKQVRKEAEQIIERYPNLYH